MSTTACPDLAKLAEHARNDLAPEDTAVLDRHLAHCRSCLDRYVELGRGSLVQDIHDCHIVKEIGRGRFGVVYKAWWLQDRPRIVALKVLSSPGDMEKSRFEREIAVLKKIDSPWIVKCLDARVSGDTTYYVMDYVEGVHLDEYLLASAHDLNGKLAVLQRVCRAVADAHAQGVVHRDLKPRNILIDADGQPHILDFGICALEAADWSSWERLTITHPGDIIGTLKYMSPEQAWGGVAGPIDERSDIWALGVMLYGIVTGGGYPYPLGATPDKSAHEALIQRIRKELPRLPRLRHLPRGRDLEVLLQRCLAWEPDRRIESARRLADDLERYCAGQRIKTRPLRLPYRLKRLAIGLAARSRWIFSAVLLAALGMTLWITTYLFNVGWHASGWPDRGQGDPSATLAAAGQARESILVVGISDDTVDAVVKFASKERIEGVTASVPTWRAVHGHLMKRLAVAHPRAIVWDYYFPTSQAGDACFAAGVNELEQGGVPVIVAAWTYREDGAPDVSPAISEPLGRRLRHGAIVARDMVRRPGEFVLAIKRAEDTIVPSLPLATLAALVHPDARLELDWAGRRKAIDLLYEVQPGAYLRERGRIELTRVFQAGRSGHALPADDLLGVTTFALEKPERWARQTVSYQTLLSCSDDELRALVRGRLIIVGDFRTTPTGYQADRHRVKYNASIVNDVPGCYLQADAIAGLLDRRYLRAAFPLSPTTFLGMLLVAALGGWLPVKLAAMTAFEERRHRRALWVVLLGLSGASFLVMVLTRSFAAVHLGMAGFSLLTVMGGSFCVEFARDRHRILDRSRRAIEDLAPAADGTITLPPTPRRPLRGTE